MPRSQKSVEAFLDLEAKEVGGTSSTEESSEDECELVVPAVVPKNKAQSKTPKRPAKAPAKAQGKKKLKASTGIAGVNYVMEIPKSSESELQNGMQFGKTKCVLNFNLKFIKSKGELDVIGTIGNKKAALC